MAAGLAALVADALPRSLSAHFWRYKYSPNRRLRLPALDRLRETQHACTFADIPPSIDASEPTTAGFLDRLDLFYACHRMRHFIGNRLALYHAAIPTRSPFLDASFVRMGAGLSRRWKLSSRFHRHLIARFCPRLLDFPTDDTITSMAQHDRPLYWLRARPTCDFNIFSQVLELPETKALLLESPHLDQFAPRLSFFFNAHSNFLEEVAKFRAARRMWAKIMRDRFQAKNPKSENNIVRTAIQAMAAVLGGTQSLHTNSFDEALALPTEASARIALRTQQVIAFESGAPQTVDPLAGSYYVESLTSEIEKRAVDYLEKIEAMGGMLKAIERGYVQQEIQNAAYEYQQAVDRLEAVVVGVNRFHIEQEHAVPIQRIDPALEPKQVERLRAVRAKRDAGTWKAALRAVEDTARSGDNLMPRILTAVEANATVGEISDAMRKVYGEYKEAVVI